MTIFKILRKFILVTKPGIVGGNLVAAAGGFLLAAGGRIDHPVFLPAVLGISLVVAAGCVFNNYLDRHLDRKMTRTRHRVLAKGAMSQKTALVYGSMLVIVGLLILKISANSLTITIVAGGLIIYVGLYTLYLKRNSLYSTIIGSLAGAAPPVAGYCAVSNHFDTGAVLLLSIFCLWQIPHSYSIAMYCLDDYRIAGVPVLPLSKGSQAAKKQILIFIMIFSAVSLTPTLFGYTGYGYLVTAISLGLTWLALALAGYRNHDTKLWAKRLFVFSLLGIVALSFMMAFDSAVSPPAPVNINPGIADISSGLMMK